MTTDELAADQTTPGLARRLASLMYEGVVLFGVVFVAGYLYSSLTQQRHALAGMHGLQAFLFLVLGIYFMWFWTHGGQTVAMKAWHLRLVDRHGQGLQQGRALARYLSSWLWFAPGMASIAAFNLSGTGPIFGALVAGMLAYGMLAKLLPQGQFLHDCLCGTRIVTKMPVARRKTS
jgi:uncharacterized RDD family membrane protein YckC